MEPYAGFLRKVFRELTSTLSTETPSNFTFSAPDVRSARDLRNQEEMSSDSSLATSPIVPDITCTNSNERPRGSYRIETQGENMDGLIVPPPHGLGENMFDMDDDYNRDEGGVSNTSSSNVPSRSATPAPGSQSESHVAHQTQSPIPPTTTVPSSDIPTPLTPVPSCSTTPAPGSQSDSHVTHPTPTTFNTQSPIAPTTTIPSRVATPVHTPTPFDKLSDNTPGSTLPDGPVPSCASTSVLGSSSDMTANRRTPSTSETPAQTTTSPLPQPLAPQNRSKSTASHSAGTVPPTSTTQDQAGQDRRRSGRAITLTSKVKESQKTNGKENKAPDNLSAGKNVPEWLQSSLSHIVQRELGLNWHKCVKKWLDLEARLGYGNGENKVRVYVFPSPLSAWLILSNISVYLQVDHL